MSTFLLRCYPCALHFLAVTDCTVQVINQQLVYRVGQIKRGYAAYLTIPRLVLTNFLPRCMECRRGLAMRILPVCLSVKHENCDKTVEKYVQIFIPYERSFSLVYREKE